jgi:hypothetical protein
MKVDIRYAQGELEFVLGSESPTEKALIDAIRANEPKLEWTNKTAMPGDPTWARFALNINGNTLVKSAVVGTGRKVTP